MPFSRRVWKPARRCVAIDLDGDSNPQPSVGVQGCPEDSPRVVRVVTELVVPPSSPVAVKDAVVTEHAPICSDTPVCQSVVPNNLELGSRVEQVGSAPEQMTKL